MKRFQILVLTAVLLVIALAMVLRSSADNPAKAGDVSEARIASDASDGNNWLLNGRTFDAQHFSPLKAITDQNISGLGLAWFLDIESGMGIVAEPIVVDGVIYVSAPLSKVYAVDATTRKVVMEV
jgi:glucose dehydrogenase